jgi:hypothetical protein
MCKVRKPGAAERTILAPPHKVQWLLDSGKATLGECEFPANGVVMCTTLNKQGVPRNIVVPERKVTKRLGRGDTLGECQENGG